MPNGNTSMPTNSSSAVQWENAEIPRDRFGRPMVAPLKGTKRVAYRRTTTFVGCLDDMNGLIKWKARQVAYGMGQRKDLVLAAAAADPDDKRTLGEVAEKASEHAQSSASATTGTALHALTERIDRGGQLGFVPVEYQADLDAYQKATDAIKFVGIETFRVHDEWQVAGTADRIGRLPGQDLLTIFDIKSGSIDYPHKMAMQLAMYAHSIPYDIAADKRGTDVEMYGGKVDLNHGVIIHLPAGEGRCELYEIDIWKGWGACMLAKQVWNWRGAKDLTKPIDPSVPSPKPATWESLIANATTVERLREIWEGAKQSKQLTSDVRAMCTARSRELAK